MDVKLTPEQLDELEALHMAGIPLPYDTVIALIAMARQLEALKPALIEWAKATKDEPATIEDREWLMSANAHLRSAIPAEWLEP